jgi:anti-sigma regulatory factor (Ser/Thr protein kinase)
MNLTAAIPVEDASQVGQARRAAALMADRLEFSELQAGRVALIASELASNLVKHARGGEFLLRPVDNGDGEPAGVEMLAIDRGPGIPDLRASQQEGFSTAGTLGHGLSAIGRQADRWDIYTHEGGTAAVAEVWRTGPPPPLQQPPIALGAVNVALAGESVCGDAWTWRLRDNRLAVLVADGLGHGMQANEAAKAAVAVFGREHELRPQRLVEDVHLALKATRGAAVSALAVDLERGVASYAGLGNVSCAIVAAAGTRQSLVSHNGTAGHQAPRVQEFNYPFARNSVAIMYTDGLGSHWSVNAYPGIGIRHPSLLAGLLYRDFSRRRDDVTVVVARHRQ